MLVPPPLPSGQDRSEPPHLYAVDLDTLSVTASIDLQNLGLPNPSGNEMLAVRNPNLPQVQDRLYLGTRSPGGSDGHIVVFDITTNPAAPQLLVDFDLTPFDPLPMPPPNGSNFNVRGMVTVPVHPAFLGNDLARNVIFALGDDGSGQPSGPPDLQDRFIIFEDR